MFLNFTLFFLSYVYKQAIKHMNPFNLVLSLLQNKHPPASSATAPTEQDKKQSSSLSSNSTIPLIKSVCLKPRQKRAKEAKAE
jgi:hypothetical protein